MLFVKLGILAFLGKGVYSSFLAANIINHTTQAIKKKLRKQWEVSACSQQQD
jgi:hypothetical protein